MLKRKWTACVLLAAVLLLSAGCAKTDTLQGTWVLNRSAVNIEGDRYRQEEMTYFIVYTFDGHGKGTRTTYIDGETDTISFSYRINRYLSTASYLQIDGEDEYSQIPFYEDAAGFALGVLDENNVAHRLSFRRVSD